MVVGSIEGPPKCLAGVCHQMLALYGIFEVRLEVGYSAVSRYFMCFLHGLRDLCMTRLGLLALNGYGSRVIDILIGSVCNIGWCIIGRQAIWWEGHNPNLSTHA